MAPASPWRLPVWAEMPPMLEIADTPWITSTSPGVARLCASNSAMRLTEVGGAFERIDPLQHVAHGQGRSDDGGAGNGRLEDRTRRSRPLECRARPSRRRSPRSGSPIALKRSTAPAGGGGVAIMRMRSGAMRPVRRLSGAFTGPLLVSVEACCREGLAVNRAGYWRGGSPPTIARSPHAGSRRIARDRDRRFRRLDR